MQEDTWSVMQGSDEIAMNKTGTRPGDTLADVLFSFVHKVKTACVVTRFQERGYFPELPNMEAGSAHRGGGSDGKVTPESILADDSAFLLWLPRVKW